MPSLCNIRPRSVQARVSSLLRLLRQLEVDVGELGVAPFQLRARLLLGRRGFREAGGGLMQDAIELRDFIAPRHRRLQRRASGQASGVFGDHREASGNAARERVDQREGEEQRDDGPDHRDLAFATIGDLHRGFALIAEPRFLIEELRHQLAHPSRASHAFPAAYALGRLGRPVLQQQCLFRIDPFLQAEHRAPDLGDAFHLQRTVSHQLLEIVEAARNLPFRRPRLGIEPRIAGEHGTALDRHQLDDQARQFIAFRQRATAVSRPVLRLARGHLHVVHHVEQRQLEHHRRGNEQQTLGKDREMRSERRGLRREGKCAGSGRWRRQEDREVPGKRR
jgi:hypothetical protein